MKHDSLNASGTWCANSIAVNFQNDCAYHWDAVEETTKSYSDFKRRNCVSERPCHLDSS